MGPSVRLCLPAICSSQAGSLLGSRFDRPLIDSSGSAAAPEGVVCRLFVAVGGRTSQISANLEPVCTAPQVEVTSRPPLVEVIQRLIRKADFSRKAAHGAALDLRCSIAALYLSTWSRFLGCCDRLSIDPCKVFVPPITKFFPCLRQVLCLSVPAVKGYQAPLILVFSLTRMVLAASTVLSRMFLCFEGLCPPQELRPLGWNLSLILGWLGLFLSPSSWPQPSILHKIFFFFLSLLRRPRAIVSCTAFPFESVTHAVEGLVPSPFFLTWWLRLSILPFMFLASRRSRFHPLTSLLVVIKTNYFSASRSPSQVPNPDGSISSWLQRCVCLIFLAFTTSVPLHLLASPSAYPGSCVCFSGGLLVFEGRCSRSQEGCNASTI